MEQNMTETQVRDAVAEGKLVFEKMGLEGDIKTIWDPSKLVEVSEARAQFERLTEDERYRAYKVLDGGDQGEPMEEFDARAGRVIFVPPFQGG